MTGNEAAGPEVPQLEARKEAFAAAIRDLLQDREVVRAGRVQVLTIDSIRERIGEDWPRFAAKVRDSAQAIIKRHLTPEDTFIEVDDCCFILVFAHLDGERARFRAAALLQQVLARLFGDEAAADPRFRDLIGAHTVDIDIDREALGSVGSVFAWLKDRFDKAAAPIPAKPEPSPAVEDADFDRYFDWAREHDRKEMPTSLTFRFRPMWDVARHAMTTYACEFAAARGAGGKPVDLRWIQAQADDPRIGHLDARMLSRVARTLHEMAEGPHRFMVCCGLHYFTLESRQRRQAYLRQFRHLPEDHRRYLAMELHHLPEGIPASRAQQLVADLRPHARRVVLRLDLAGTMEARLRPEGMHIFREAGFDSVGLDVGPLQRDEVVLLKALDVFAAAAERAGLGSYVVGLRTRSQTLAAIAAGFTFIQSDIIRPAVDRPSHMFRYAVDDLFPPARPG